MRGSDRADRRSAVWAVLARCRHDLARTFVFQASHAEEFPIEVGLRQRGIARKHMQLHRTATRARRRKGSISWAMWGGATFGRPRSSDSGSAAVPLHHPPHPTAEVAPTGSCCRRRPLTLVARLRDVPAVFVADAAELTPLSRCDRGSRMQTRTTITRLRIEREH